MMTMKFKAKKKKIGTSEYVLVPKPIAEFLKSELEYVYTINEVNKND